MALQPQHAEALVALQQCLFRDSAHLVRTQADYRGDAAQERLNIRKRNERGLSLGAFDGNDLVAMLIAAREALPRRAHCASFFLGVHPGHQGMGIGSALMQQLLDWARSDPLLERLELHVHATNLAAIALYRRMGFVEEGRQRQAIKYGPDRYVDDVLMALEVRALNGDHHGA